MFKRSILAILGCLFAGYLSAQDVIVFNGGIGSDERASAPVDGTKLEFFVQGGKFLSGVKVTVTNNDSDGTVVVDTVTRGPWLILRLSPGNYHVLAVSGEQKQGADITVSEQSQSFGFMFKES